MPSAVGAADQTESKGPGAAVSPTSRASSVLAVIQPVDNAPECSNAACHVHPADQRVLGVIDANLSLATVDEQMSLHQANLAIFSARRDPSGLRARRWPSFGSWCTGR